MQISLKLSLCAALAVLLGAAVVAGEGHATLPPGASQSPNVHHILLYSASGPEWEHDKLVEPKDSAALPFSTRFTCGHCHKYDAIKAGFHFNAADPSAPAGRPGEPWLWTNRKIGVQIPISERAWPGTFKPDDVGLTPFAFVQRFGHHMTGGGTAETSYATDKNPSWKKTGPLEINCLACHNGAPTQEIVQWKNSLFQENLMWATAASCGLATVSGSSKTLPADWNAFKPVPEEQASAAPSVKYDLSRFNAKNEVYFDIERDAKNARCYACHSTGETGHAAGARWQHEMDVHLTAGMRCGTCHRNGLDHQITRNYPGDPTPGASTLTCRGCHLGEGEDSHSAGRRKAPRPLHLKLPPIHFQKLACTACHSGPKPEMDVHVVQTSRAHQTEYLGKHRAVDAAPYIVAPVFLEQADDGPIAPHKLIWPAYWGRLKDNKVTPLSPDIVSAAAGAKLDELAKTDPEPAPDGTRPPPLNEEKVKAVLGLLPKDDAAGQNVYVCSGKVFSLNSDGSLASKEHPAAQYYAWPLAHDVRPASQALGAKGCAECHSKDGIIFHGEVPTDTFIAAAKPTKVEMFVLRGDGDERIELQAWELSWMGRPYFVLFCETATILMGIVLTLFFFRGVKALLKQCS